MAKYDCNTFRNYVVFLAGRMAPGTRRPHHDSELISCYHEAFLTWGHYHINIVLFYHDSPITRSHFMDPTDRVIWGFYCIWELITVIQSSAIIMLSNIMPYHIYIHYHYIELQQPGQNLIRGWTHKRHPIPRLNRRAMGCLLWENWPLCNGTTL